MEKELWFWQYEIVIWEADKKERENISGLVAGKNIVNAVKYLYSYYGESIMNIKCLKTISDTVLEFDDEYLDDFDYQIIKKEKIK